MKLTNYIISLGICLLGGMSFINCSSDDDDEGSASSNAGVITGKANVRVTQVGTYRFYYDDKGRIDHILDGNYEGYRFTYNPNKVIWYDVSSGKDEDEVSISYNSKGFVSKLDASTSGEDGTYAWNTTGSASYSYDGQGHLVKITSSWKETGTEDGERYTEEGNGTTVFTWQNDLLVSVYQEETEKEDGEMETSKSTITYTYATDNLDDYLNEYFQYAPSISNRLEGMGDGELEEALAYVGLMGKGPKYLPMSSQEEWEEYYDGRTRTGSPSYTYRYGFNNNGTLSYATVNGYRYSYSYSNLDEDESNAKPYMKVASKERYGKRDNIVRHLFIHPKHNKSNN